MFFLDDGPGGIENLRSDHVYFALLAVSNGITSDTDGAPLGGQRERGHRRRGRGLLDPGASRTDDLVGDQDAVPVRAEDWGLRSLLRRCGFAGS